MRIALFGGTFDPIHRGHMSIATAAAEALHLDTILFAPTGLQPFKPDGPQAIFNDRLAMTDLACQQDARFTASALDAPRPDGSPNYTVHLLTTLRERYPNATLFNLAGLDSFLTLPHWLESERLLDLAEWIVVSRPGYTLDLSPYTEAQRRRIHPIDSVHEDVSATSLRERLHHGDPCLDLIAAPVSQYIAEHGLYREA
jgi:nicotinate-nucleotide adenylyltransferase